MVKEYDKKIEASEDVNERKNIYLYPGHQCYKKQPICFKNYVDFKYGSRHYNFKQKTALSRYEKKLYPNSNKDF